MESKQMKVLFTVVDKPGDKSFWLRIGTAWLNRDGSWNLKLDALPVNGAINMRDPLPREDREGFRGGHGERDGRDRDGRDARAVV